MSPIVAFIIGLLVAWIIEWIIDWVYWRRRTPAAPAGGLEDCRSRVNALELEIESYKNQIANLRDEAERAALPPVVAPTAAATVRSAARIAEPEPVPDPLEEVEGVSPAIARRLNEAGIFTFAGLAALRPQRLKEILGDLLAKLGSEVEIIKQARIKSGMIRKVDDLEVIVGIGPVIARLLNQAGIFTFAELGALNVAQLRELVGDRIERLADEEKILAQARELAADEQRGG